jgi:CRISPR-associated endonuclease Csn1
MSKKDQDKIYKKIKARTEITISNSGKTVGAYIYDTFLQNSTQKIRGKLVRTIERKFYKEELRKILEKQKEFHAELRDNDYYQKCIIDLYPHNEDHRNILQYGDFTKLFLDDVIFYQRPLKSKKSLISNCPYEHHNFKNEAGVTEKSPVKCIAKSHPLYQEFRLWQFIHNLRIYEREKNIDGKLCTDVDVTVEFIPTVEERVKLFDWLNERKDIKQDTLLQSYFKIKKKNKADDHLPYRWNYVEDKEYPCNETHALILSRLVKLGIPKDFLDKEKELALWHILYSVNDKEEIGKALKTFAKKNNLDNDFAEVFAKFPPFAKNYGSYSAKAIKKLLLLMRMGKYWDENAIATETKNRIQSICERLKALNHDAKKIEDISDDDIPKRVLKSFLNVKNPCSGLNTYQACYAVYGRHSESSDITKWNTPQDIDKYLEEFKQHSLRNPIVEQVILETLRVVRDVWKKYGTLSEIHIELGREMRNPADERAKMTTKISENENTNLRIKALLMELKNHADVENVRPYSPNQQEILKLYEEGVLSSVSEIPDDIIKITKSSQPTQSELVRYKLWLEQKYRSPYTGEIIPLSKLFTSDYEIEHIIPQSRYFDDSFSNKVICEAEVNKLKDNALGYEFIKKHGGEKVELSFGKTVEILSIEAYEKFVKDNYGKLRGKMKKLLLEDIPESFIERQLNDSRYISKIVKSLLSNIVREEGEQEATSKNVILCTGGITNILKQDWGLNDVWNRIITPRFERMNHLTGTTSFTAWNEQYQKFLPTVPLELSRGFQKKRIDHRHHALDAIIIACATREHVQYLNNEHAQSKNDDVRYGLKQRLCFKVKTDEKGSYKWQFHKPWDTFTQDVLAALENIIISFKQNLRVINKTTNRYQVYENGKKIVKPQEKGDSWAIRKPLHKDTIFAKVSLRKTKKVKLDIALKDWKSIVNKELKNKIKHLTTTYGSFDVEKIIKYFKDRNYLYQQVDISKVDIYYFEDDSAAVRKTLDASFNAKTIESITDTGIQKILLNHLAKKENNSDVAFSPEGIEEMNKNIVGLNDGKPHQPIYKVRIYEPIGNKFPVGYVSNKQKKYVEAAKGTNLFFAIYSDGNGNRTFDTIPLNIVIERLKQGLQEVPEKNEKGQSLLFHLSPNDLVYVPVLDESLRINIKDIKLDRIYKFIDSSDTTANFIPMSSASLIFNMAFKEQQKRNINMGIQNEFGVGSPQSKNQKAITGEMIKDVCIKLKVDRLGNITGINGRKIN